jgi:hypothetical protein
MTVDFDRADAPPAALQVLHLIFFAGFAIVATVVALNVFWPGGLALAAFLGWRGFGLTPPRMPWGDARAVARDLAPEAPRAASGNHSFDAYRAELLDRLEEERAQFEGFLGRLRAARDQGEFDRFMEARAARAAADPA